MSGTGSPSLLLAFWAGIVSFVSPCVLPLVPGYLAAVSGTRPGEARGLDPRVLAQEGLGVALVVLRVHAEEGDAPAVPAREAGEERELEAARPAPRGPLVDNDRMAPQRAELLLERRRATTQELVGLAVERRQASRRGARAGLRAAARRGQDGGQAGEEDRDGDARHRAQIRGAGY